MGLSSEQVAGLFQPFNRLGQEAGTQEGTGIGLVVTRRLVELMGGEIGVTSSPGVGSVFWIELACVDVGAAGAAETPTAAHAGAAPARADVSAASPATVLYIEDNPANLKLVQEIVRFRPDLRLVCAPDGHFGLSLARSQLPDVILMDLNLPGLSGFEVLAQLRREPETARIPAIAVSANAMRADIERALAAGFARYLTKPIDIGQFNEAIDGVLATRAVDENQPQ
jgi:CheY-like chemotaxis protein